MVHLDGVASLIHWGGVDTTFKIMRHWKARFDKKRMCDYSAVQFVKYAESQRTNDKDLNNLSFPQLIVLYGKLWEKEILPEHLKEIERLLND